MNKRNHILTIAGHDPSGGAGITSDIKTFEAHGLYGLSVCTAITIQNDSDFKACSWVSTADILAQIEVLFERFQIDVVKIGIVASWESLQLILIKLHDLNPELKIVLDPILKASAGFDFHGNNQKKVMDSIWKHCFIVTPNYNEIQELYPEKTVEETLTHMTDFTTIYLKGGHRRDKKGWDEIYQKQMDVITIPPKATQVFDKHGSGCVLSSALASNLALGNDLEKACKQAKYYTEQFLNSHASLLGTHTKTERNDT